MPTKRDSASGVVVDTRRIPGSLAEPSAEEVTHTLDSAGRRHYRKSVQAVFQHHERQHPQDAGGLVGQADCRG